MNTFHGWDLRKLYEQQPADLMEAEAFFAAFAKFHDINGHSIECIYTKAKHQPVIINGYSHHDKSEGIHAVTGVLIVKNTDMQASQGDSIRIDGNYCLINSVSHPILGLTRFELEGYSE